MTDAKFIHEAQQCETLDERARKKKARAEEKISGKRKIQDNDGNSNLNRTQRDKNESNKRSKRDHKTTNAGTARRCELCKLSGAPDFVWKSHETKDCKKKGSYAHLLSGGTASRKRATDNHRSHEKSLKREIKLLQKIKTLKTKTKKSKKDDMDISSVSSEDTNVSY